VSNQCELQHAIVLFRSDLFKRNKRERYVDALHKALNKFMRHFGEQGTTRPVSDISRIGVTGFLDTAIKETPVNRYNHIRDLGVFFNWAVNEKMIAENPVSDIKRPTVDRRAPEVLTFKQAKAMLKNATARMPLSACLPESGQKKSAV
jgi:site-specific recombinase XerD